MFTSTETPIPRVATIAPSFVPGSTFAIFCATAAHGIRKLDIFPVKNAIYVPGTPITGKYDTGSTNQFIPTALAIAINPVIIAFIGGIILNITASTRAGPNDKNTPSQFVILPHLFIYGKYSPSYIFFDLSISSSSFYNMAATSIPPNNAIAKDHSLIH